MTQIPEFSSPEQLVQANIFHNVRWLTTQLNRGIFTGYKSGNQWRMTRQDVESALEKLKNNKNTNQPTAAARRRRAS